MTTETVLRTQTFDDRVRYEVERDGKVIWHTEVAVGRDGSDASGVAMVKAMRQQFAVAIDLATDGSLPLVTLA